MMERNVFIDVSLPVVLVATIVAYQIGRKKGYEELKIKQTLDKCKEIIDNSEN